MDQHLQVLIDAEILNRRKDIYWNLCSLSMGDSASRQAILKVPTDKRFNTHRYGKSEGVRGEKDPCWGAVHKRAKGERTLSSVGKFGVRTDSVHCTKGTLPLVFYVREK